MATISAKFRASAQPRRPGTVYYQIIHQRQVRCISSAHRLLPSEWDPRHTPLTHRGIAMDLQRLHRIDSTLQERGLPYCADDLAARFRLYMRQGALSTFMVSVIDHHRSMGHLRTSETHTVTLNSFSRFLADTRPDSRGDIMLDCISTDVIEAYQAWLRARGAVANTVSFYCRVLRAVYNRAVERGLIADARPFRHVYTGVDKTVKRALPLRTISRINKLDLTHWPALDYARDIFMLSFFLRGMSFIDMAFLRRADLSCGYVTYRRRKTGQLLTIRWTPQMQAVVDKYPAYADSPYLFPIIRRTGGNERRAYRNAASRINLHLKQLASLAGVHIPLTLYVARHSWASAARSKGIPLSVISEGLGHDNEATTRIYLASLDTSSIDRANDLILSSL